MARTRPCRVCGKTISKKSKACPGCGDPTQPKRQPGTLAVVMLGTIVGVAALAGTPRDSGTSTAQMPAQRRAPRPPRSVALPATDEQVLAVINKSDDLEQHQTALVAASRAFMAKGGTLADLREMGGWVRSQTHEPRGVYFTYKRPGTHVRDRWYYDVDRGQLFQ